MPQTLPEVEPGNGQSSSSRFPLPKRVHPNVKMPIVGATLASIYTFLAANVANLTTVFTPPASCTTPCYFPDDIGRFDVALIGTACSYAGNDHRGCEPGSYDTSATKFPYYSPGICPEGFTTACSPISEISFSTNVTAQVCCQRGFTCNHNVYRSDYSAQCISFVPVSSFITPIFLHANITASGGPTVYTSLTASPVDIIGTVACAGITVAWEATDTAIVNLLASSSSALSAAGSSTMASSSTSSPLISNRQTTSSQSPTSQPGKGGLSVGAKGGIGIGIAIAILLVAGGILIYIRRLKKALKAARVGPEQMKSELPATEKKRLEPVEADVIPHVTHELVVNEIPVELDGQERGEVRRS